MKLRILLSLLGAGALLVTTGVAMRVASADEAPELTSVYAEAGSWNGGLIGAFTITNPASTPVNDWKLTFGLSDKAMLAGVWNGTLSASKDTFTLTPTAQTKVIAGKGEVTVGFTALADVRVLPVKCVINGKKCKIDSRSSAKNDAEPAADPAAGTPDEATAAQPEQPDQPNRPGSGGTKAGVALPGGTSVTPYVPVATENRPPLKAIASGSHSSLLTLTSLLPVGSGCELKWGGALDIGAYAKEITDALTANVGLIASITATQNIDIAQACGTVGALEGQLKKVLDTGVRTLDFTIPGNLLGDGTINLRRATALKNLKGLFPGLKVVYTLPANVLSGNPLAAIDTLTAPLTVARGIGLPLDRLNILPVDLAAPSGLLGSLLPNLGVASTVDGLLTTVKGLQAKLMKIQGLDAAGAYRMLGIVPVIGSDELLGKADLLGNVQKLTTFAKANGLGLLGFLPLGTAGSCGSGGLLGILPALPVLGCLDANILPRFFSIADLFNSGLR